MTTNPNYHSDSELIKRLQIVLRDASDPFHDRQRAEGNQREVRNLTAELAERIYAEPDKWGLSTIPEGLRDDAASDALLALLVEVPDFRARQPVAEWYVAKVEECYQRLWAISQRQAAEPRAPESPATAVDGAATPDAEALITLARERRLDIRAVRQAVAVAETRLREQWRMIFPAVAVGVALERAERKRLGGRDLLADTARSSIGA